MTTTLKKLWRDPVWSKVIAGVILSIGAAVAAYFLNWWPAIRGFVAKFAAFALASTPMPNWLLFFLLLLALPTIILIGAFGWQKIFPPQPATPSWREYTTDVFFALRWRWLYKMDGQVYNAHTFCPHCDFQVYAQDIRSFNVGDRIAFNCEGCGCYLGEFQESYNSLESKVRRSIQQKLRNNTWLQPDA